MQQRTVAVTGGNGFIGLRIVNQFLQNNWKVVATVRDSQNEQKIKELKKLPNATQNLKLVSADLMEEQGFVEAFQNVDTVVHNASPVIFTATGQANEENTLKPAVQGTVNVFNAILKNSSTIKNVIQISSTSAVTDSPGSKAKDYVYSSDDWSDAKSQRDRNGFYNLSKTMAEQKVNEYKPEFEKLGIKLSSICPTFTLGPQLQTQSPCLTTGYLINFLKGDRKEIPNQTMSYVDVRDIAELVYQCVIKNVQGRFLGVENGHTIEQLVETLRKFAQEEHIKNIPTQLAEGEKAQPQLYDLKNSIELLGRPFITFDQMVQDSLKVIYEFKFIQ